MLKAFLKAYNIEEAQEAHVSWKDIEAQETWEAQRPKRPKRPRHHQLMEGRSIWLKHALGPIYMEKKILLGHQKWECPSNFCELFHFLLYIASGHFLLYTACGHVHCTVYIVHCTGWMERGEIKTAWITSSCCHLTQRIWLRNKKEKQNRKGSNWSSSAWLCYDDSIREYQFIQHRKVNHKISIHATYM